MRLPVPSRGGRGLGRVVTLLWLAALALIGSPASGQAQEPPRPSLIINGYALDTDTQKFNLGERAAWPHPSPSRYAVLQVSGPVRPEWRDTLTRLGVRLDDYLPDFGYVARIEPSQWEAVRGLPFVRYLGAFEPAFRVSRAVDTQRDTPLTVNIVVHEGESLDSVAKAVDSLGGRTLALGSHDLQASLAADHLPTLAASAAVRWIGEAQPIGPLNFQESWRIQSGIANSRPIWERGLLGQGQIIALADSGLDANHECFYDPARPQVQVVEQGQTRPPDPTHRKVVNYWRFTGDTGDAEGHGSHVGGTLACDNAILGGSGNEEGQGMAPRARLSFTDLAVGAYFPVPSISDVTAIFENGYADGARIHNESWGEFQPEPKYTEMTRAIDDAMWRHKDMLVVVANGNGLRVGPPATAKSIVSVGAETLSVGPTLDGRIKPTLLAPGTVISAQANAKPDVPHAGYIPSTGTSMAAPTVAGGLALIRQYFTDGWYPAGAPDPARTMPPSAALLKATLLAGTTELAIGARDTEHEGHVPNNSQGWGFINLDRSLSFAGEKRRLWVADETAGLTTDQQASYNVIVTDTSEPLRLALTWTDYPAAYGSLGNVTNDLDLRVQAPDGRLYLGNVTQGLNPTASQPGGRADRVNVEEGVFLPTPDLGLVTGVYTVTVSAYNAPHGPQAFALAVTGGLAATPLDTTPPGVTATAPGNGATAVPITTTLTLTFSEAMNRDSVSQALTLTPTLSGNLAWEGTTLRFTPSAPLFPQTAYTMTVATTAADLAGNRLAQPFRLTFNTGALSVVTPTPSPPPPAPGAPIGPASAYTGAAVALYAAPADPGRPLRYRFDFGDGAALITDTTSPTTWARAGHAWGRAGRYEVRLQSLDDTGQVSPWSASLAVVVSDAPADLVTAATGNSAAVISPRANETQQAQTFIASAGSLSSVSLALTKASSAPTFRLLVSVTNDPGVADLILGPALPSGTPAARAGADKAGPTPIDAAWGLVTPADVAATAPAGPDWVRVSLNKPLHLGAGQRVYVIVRPYEAGEGAYLWRTDDRNPYRRGEFYRGPDWQRDSRTDALLRLSLGGSPPNLAPLTPPAPLGPARADANTTSTYRAIADDPDGNASQAVFDWGDGTQTSLGAPSGGGIIQASHIWPRPGAYAVRVRAVDGAGALSAWGAPLTVTVSGIDAIPPRITNVAVLSITLSSAVVTWTTDEPASGQVDFGPTAAYGDSLTGAMVTMHHSVPLGGLRADTIYHFRVSALDAAGNRATSADATFRTAAEGSDPPQLAAAHARYVTATGARITWRTDRPATSYVELSVPPSPPISLGSGDLATEHSVELVGLVPGLQYHYRVRSDDAQGNQALGEDRTFITRSQAPWTAYHSYAKVNSLQSELQRLAAEFPEVVKLTSIGDSPQGRDIVALKLSDNPNADEEEPEVILTSGLHAREWIAVEALLYTTYELVNRYGIDPEVTRLLDSREVWILPMLNPDGRVIDGYDDGIDHSRSRNWRKNARDNNSDGAWDVCDGVDLNRNFELGWGIGASASPCHEEYQGAAAWSEPETEALRQFVLARQARVVTDIHAYGNEIVYPWGYLMTPAPDDARLRTIGAQLAALVPNMSARQAGLDGAEGGAFDDWAYASGHALTFTLEVGSADRPAPATILTAVAPYRPLLQRLIDLAADPWGMSPTSTPLP